MAPQVTIVQGYWISTCPLCVNGEVKTKCPEQGTCVGERNRSFRRHNQRLAERHGEGVCTVTIIAAAADKDAAAANDGLPANLASQVSICALCSRHLLHFHHTAFPVELCANCPLWTFVLCGQRSLARRRLLQ